MGRRGCGAGLLQLARYPPAGFAGGSKCVACKVSAARCSSSLVFCALGGIWLR